jgi:hypothetical protein
LDLQKELRIARFNCHAKYQRSQKTISKEPEGQLISKRQFGFFNSPEKRTKFAALFGQKFEFSSSFFERIGDTKKTF